MGEPSVLCCKSGCQKVAAFYWPAFDRNIQPAPYCHEHMEEAKEKTSLDGPKFILPKNKTAPLAAV